MPLAINAFEPPTVDKRRLLEDMGKTVQVFRESQERGRPIYPTSAALRELGDLFLSGRLMGEFTAGSDLNRIVDAWHYPIFSGTVKLSYFLMSIIIACKDCWAVESDDRLDLERGARWLILEGIHHLRLWPFLSRDFIRQLRVPTLSVRGCVLSPLQLCAILERSEVAPWSDVADVHQSRKAFTEWLLAQRPDGRSFFWAQTFEEFCRQINAPVSARLDRTTDSSLHGLHAVSFGPSVNVRRHLYPDLGNSYCLCRLTLRSNASTIVGSRYVSTAASLDIVSADLPAVSSRSMVFIVEFEACDLDLRDELCVKFSIGAAYEATVEYPRLAGLPLFVLVTLRHPARHIEISFVRNNGEPVKYFGDHPPRLRSLAVWRL